MLKMSDINDYLTTNTGIFDVIQTNHSSTFTWLSSDDADALDLEYYLQHSGNKYISPLVDKLYNNDSTTYLTQVAKVIVLRFKDKWNKLYDAYINSDYNPLYNYDMTEDEKVATDVTTSTNGNENVFGFNTTSEDGVEQSKSGVSSTTTGLFDDNHRQLTRQGNIGVMTTEDLLTQEIQLRQWNFYQEMMKDVDSVMCLSYREV